MKFIPKNQQIIMLRNENEKLKAENEKNRADVVYTAMMTGVELQEDADAEESENE